MSVGNIKRFITSQQLIVLIDDGEVQDFNRQLDKPTILKILKPESMVALEMVLPYHQAHPSRELIPHHRVFATFITNEGEIKQAVLDVSDNMWTVLPDHLIIPAVKE